MKDVHERKIPYGLIGSGHMGWEHVRNLTLIPGSEVAFADLGLKPVYTSGADLDYLWERFPDECGTCMKHHPYIKPV